MSEADDAFAAAEAAFDEVRQRGMFELDLSGKDFLALDRLPEDKDDLAGLRELNLRNTQIADLSHLAGLKGLETLRLDNTPVADLTPLAGQTALRVLSVSDTPVADLTPISGLDLRELDAGSTRVQDLGPLASVPLLEWLWLAGAPVADIAPLAGLRFLRELTLSNTLVSDLTPLANLGLVKLYLAETAVSDLTPIAGLISLRELTLANTQVADLAPLAGLTKLTRLGFNKTSVADVTPLAGLTKLTWLDLNKTSVADLAPLASLTALQSLNLDDTPVTDLRPLRVFTRLAEEPRVGSITFRNCAAARADPRIAEIAEIRDPVERAATLFAYLEDWEPLVEPTDDALLPVGTEGGRLEVAATHPDAAEQDDGLKRHLHTRLVGRATDLERLAGNRFYVLCAKARSLGSRLDRPFEMLDMLNIHLDVEELSRISDRGTEREGDEPFTAEVADALADVVAIGPGLTLDNAAVELLEERKRRWQAGPPPAAAIAAQNAMSAALAADEAAVGPNLRALENDVLSREPDATGYAVQDALHRNVLIRLGRWALARTTGVFEGVVASFVTLLLQSNWPLIADAVQLYGPGFARWFLSAMARVQDLAAVMANVEMRPIGRPGDE